jgi:hypothetical protein
MLPAPSGTANRSAHWTTSAHREVDHDAHTWLLPKDVGRLVKHYGHPAVCDVLPNLSVTSRGTKLGDDSFNSPAIHAIHRAIGRAVSFVRLSGNHAARS